MKHSHSIVWCLLCCCLPWLMPKLTAATTVVWSDDFEQGLEVHSFHNDSNIIASVAASPLTGDGHGQVLLFADKLNTGQWGSELRATGHSSGSILISNYGATPGVDTFRFTFDYFIPENTVSFGNDDLGVMVRFTSGTVNGGNSVTTSSFVNATSAAKGQWLQFELTGVIPLTDTVTNSPVLYMTPFILWNDKGEVNPPGLLGYIDNVSFMVTPEPSRALLLLVGLASTALIRRRR